MNKKLSAIETASQKHRKKLDNAIGDNSRSIPANLGQTEQEQILRILAEQNTPRRRVALRLGRTSTAVQSKAKEINLSLNPIKGSD